jgi:hypothetical protein
MRDLKDLSEITVLADLKLPTILYTMQTPIKDAEKAVPSGKISGSRGLRWIASLSLLVLISGSPSKAANSVSQYGITWTFSQDRPVGQFANGDWWVVGPVTITNISPKTGDGGINFSSGSMINPIPGESGTQGFYQNGGPTHPENLPKYDAAKNISLHLPITVAANNSVCSTMNNPDTYKGSLNASGNWILAEDAEKTWFKEFAILTVVAAAPAEGSFRPPYAGSNKTIKSNWNVNNLNYSVLRSLAVPIPSNAPSMTWLEDATQRPLLEMNFGYLNSNFKATWAENKPGGYPRRAYGREVSGISSGAGLMLNSNLSNAQKKKLATHMVQWGIDTYGLLENGMQYWGSGGHQNGRLIPVYLAGKMLNDGQILARASGNSPLQELLTHFFVGRSQIDTPRSPPTPTYPLPNKPYTEAMLGMPEWCFGYPGDPNNSAAWDNSEGFNYSGYRYVNGGSNCGTVATILLMGGRAEVNHEAFFTYHIDLYYPRQRPTGNAAYSSNSNGIQPFVRDMWDVHIRGLTAPPVDPPVDPPVGTSSFAVGDRIQVNFVAPAAVYASAASTNQTGTQAGINLGTIIAGPVANGNVKWFQINYDNGVDGWTNESAFSKSYSPPYSTFAVGDSIQTWRTTYVNSTASTNNLVGQQSANVQGTIVEGPIGPDGSNIVWFKINYSSGVDGWSGADNLKKSSSPPLSTRPSKPTGLRVVE